MTKVHNVGSGNHWKIPSETRLIPNEISDKFFQENNECEAETMADLKNIVAKTIY